MQNMVQVMELSPHVFHNMGEEDLRTHFLVQLNGAFKGQATGETFNFQGKTDILIRIEGKTSSSPSANSGRVRKRYLPRSTSFCPTLAGGTQRPPCWFSIEMPILALC